MPRVAQPAAKLPLHPSVLLVLLVLAEGPLHGYRIRTTVKERSEGQLSLDPGTLYRLIARLEAEGLVEATRPPRKAERQDERRRYYKLTKRGRTVLLAETARLESLVRATRRMPALRGAREA